MPELPEVQTIVDDLKQKVMGHKILDVTCDWENLIREPSFRKFKEEISGLIIEDIKRRAKNIIINLSAGKSLLIHLKMTGHFLVSSCWEFKRGRLRRIKNDDCPEDDPIEFDKMNHFVHLGFRLDKNKNLMLSDLRKFAEIKLIDTEELPEYLSKYGPEPLSEHFTYEKFKQTLSNQKGKIKQVLMDQNVLAGIGNIYSDEILFEAKIHPQQKIEKITKKKLKKLFFAIKNVLQTAIKNRGDSVSDYRDTEGKKGKYQEVQKVYRKTGKPCLECEGEIKRIKIGGRSAHYCPKCQKK